MASEKPIKFYDPHFHIWDLSTPFHDLSILGGCGEAYPNFTIADYEKSVQTAGFEPCGGVWLECISDKVVGEAEWAAEGLKKSDKEYKIVPRAYLEQSNVKSTLDQLTKIPNVVGIRQILNYNNPTYPRVTENLLENKKWIEGYAMLEKYGLSFDLQLNPWQLEGAFKVIEQFPKIPVIVNHLATPKLEDEPIWRQGMHALSRLPNVFVKLSMLQATEPDWDRKTTIKGMVRDTVRMFGSSRCMFASNYPVDLTDKFDSRRLFTAFMNICDGYHQMDIENLFYNTGYRAYNRDNKFHKVGIESGVMI